MARDAQLGGDRVQSEYYLQYAEHYFRVLNENRSRFEDQRRNRDDDSSDEDDNEEETVEASEASDDDRSENEGRRRRTPSRDRSSRNGVPPADSDSEAQDERIAVEVLPPAIGRESEEEEEPAAKPRRRT